MTKDNQNHELIEFGVQSSKSEHDAIQKWRLNNPDGFILNMKSKMKGMLHSAVCHHIGDVSLEVTQHAHPNGVKV